MDLEQLPVLGPTTLVLPQQTVVLAEQVRRWRLRGD
jgi:hypothetical protein